MPGRALRQAQGEGILGHGDAAARRTAGTGEGSCGRSGGLHLELISGAQAPAPAFCSGQGLALSTPFPEKHTMG
jgi:hypothetical protein